MGGFEASRDGDVHSELSGTAGNAVMARDISGGVHFHESVRPRLVCPRELPDPVGVFTNRVAELKRIDGYVAGESADDGCPIVVVLGTPGVGKTSLGLRWAQLAAPRYPDGQLYLDMQGYHADEPMAADLALMYLLESLGVARSAIPSDAGRRAALYRSLMAGRRRIVFLDNVSPATKIKSLVPSGAGTVVLVTARAELASLAMSGGAHSVTIEVLPEAEAVELLRRVIADRRGGDDPELLARLARLCARLPLALSIAAERFARRPAVPLSDFVASIEDEAVRLDALSQPGDDAAVRAVFAWSYRDLSVEAARVFRAVGVHPALGLSVASVAVTAGLTQEQAREAFDVLVGAHLVNQVDVGQFEMHDLLRAYAAETARREDGEGRCRLAVLNVVAWYQAMVTAARVALGTGSLTLPPAPGYEDVVVVAFASAEAASAWCARERANFTPVVAAATRVGGGDDLAWRLAGTLLGVYEVGNDYENWFATSRLGLEAARRLGDPFAVAVMLESMGKACHRTSRLDAALEHHGEALALRESAGDSRGRIRSLNAIGLVHLEAGRYEEAQKLFEMVRDLADASADIHFRIFGVLNLASVNVETKRFESAIELADRALKAVRALGLRVYEVNALRVLATALRGHQRLDEAADVIAQAVQIAAALDNQLSLAIALKEQAAVARDSGRWEDALASYSKVIDIHRASVDRGREAAVLDEIAETYAASGRPNIAIDTFRTAAGIYRELGDERHATASDARIDAIASDEANGREPAL